MKHAIVQHHRRTRHKARHQHRKDTEESNPCVFKRVIHNIPLQSNTGSLDLAPGLRSTLFKLNHLICNYSLKRNTGYHLR